MKQFIIMALCCMVLFACSHKAMPSHTPVINGVIKNENNDTILAGHCALAILQTAPYNEWYSKNYAAYTADSSTVAALSQQLELTTIDIFLGSWCGDSKREVPRMIKILEQAHFDTNRVQLIFVDNSTATYKQSPQHEEAGKNIHHVPTFIVYKGRKELGRIVETPVVSLEKDLLAIAGGDTYIPKYKAITYWRKKVKNREDSLSNDQLQQLVPSIQPLCLRRGEFNAYGYVLLAQKSYREALNVFILNTLLYPAEADVYDSLGEAYMATGNSKAAIRNYEKVLEMKPGDENAVKMLAKLRQVGSGG